MAEQIVNLTTLADVVCNLGQVDTLKLNNITIWTRNESTKKFTVVSEGSTEIETENTLNDFAWSGERIVVVGNNKSIYSSDDFINWTSQMAQSAGSDFYSVAYGEKNSSNKTFVAVGNYLGYDCSSDTNTWKTITGAAYKAALNKAFVFGSGYYLVSSPNSWGYISISTGNNSFSEIANNGYQIYDTKNNLLLLDDGYIYYRSNFYAPYTALKKRSYLGNAKKLLADTLDTSITYALYDNGVYKSTDGFVTFETIEVLTNETFIDFGMTNSGAIFFVCENGNIYTTKDFSYIEKLDLPMQGTIFSKAITIGDNILLGREDNKQFYKITITENI